MGIRFLNRVIGIVAPLTAQIHCGKAVDGHIGALIHSQKSHHLFLRHIGLESHLFPHPIGALFGNGLLGQFIAQFDLKISPIQATLPVQSGDIELPLLFGNLLLDERRRGEDKSQLINAVQLLLQLLIGIDGETGGGDGYFASFFDRGLQIRPHCLIDIV